MPALGIVSTTYSQDDGLTMADMASRLAHGSEGDYALLSAGPGAGVLATQPLCRLMVDAAGAASIEGDARIVGEIPDLPAGKPLEALQRVVEAVRFPQPHQMVGWLGSISYDVVRFLESIEPPHRAHAPAPGELHWPCICFTLFRHYLLFHPAAEGPLAYTLGEPGAAFDWRALAPHRPVPQADPAESESIVLEKQTPEAYANKVQRVKAYIAQGDIYQANLAQRWIIQTTRHPQDVYQRLCTISPAPWAACLRFHDGLRERHVVSASPELFLAVNPEGDGRTAVTRPIKGTRPRDSRNPAADQALREELVASEKDHAELTMIVDLLRNDLGRVSEFGTVRVLEPRAVEQHPTVWHTVATIASRLRAEARLGEILAAVCPGGSITGAPKIRAMQIIEELEGFRRGLYCGNIGVIGDGGGSMALNIAIRTMLFDRGRAYVYAGGGIVADSDPGREYEETLHKARAMFEALGLQLPH